MAATFETRASNAGDFEDANYSLLGHQKRKSASKCSWKLAFIVLLLFSIGAIIAAVFVTKSIVEKNNGNNNAASDSGEVTSSSPSMSPTMEPTMDPSMSPTMEPTTNPTMEPSESPTATPPPKNLIIIISDGMGQTYNAAYRKYKNITRTTIDKHFKGRYSTTPTNIDGITDSAAGATVFACGVKTHDSFVCLDGYGNPKASILAAAKRQGKGTGIVVTKSVTDATPAAFSAHSLYRSWQEMISKQQTMRQINGEPMLDILFGGGRKYFERWGFFRNATMWDEYGWNKVTDNTTRFLEELDEIDISEMPYMALFADSSFPYYLDRLNGDDLFINDSNEGVQEYPGLIDMSQKAINLLSTKYEEEGFFLLIEASEVDLCGHDNDIVCALWEIEEFMETTEWVLEWAQNDTETLVVMLSDHETGGMALGRDGSYYDDDIVKYWDGTQPRDGDAAAAWYSFDNAYGISPPSDVSSFVEHYGAYKWHPDAVARAKHTADWFADKTGSHGEFEDIEDIYYALETMYIGGNVDDADNNITLLTDVEKDFIQSAMKRSSSTRKRAVAALMNARTLTGWTTHGHSSADCAVHAFGPFEDEFIGHWQNFEIGILMREIFGVETEQQEELELMEELFINGSLKICNPDIKPSYIEWNISVVYPEGNILAGNYCVEAWIDE